MCFKRIILTNLNQGTVRKELKIEKNGHHNCKYNGTPLVRPPIFHQKSGLSRGVASQGRNQYIYVYIYIVKWPFQRGWPLVRVASQKGFHCNHFQKLRSYQKVYALMVILSAASLVWRA